MRSIVLACAILACAVAAHGEERRMAWSTYLRTGPGDGYAVTDEVRHDETVDVRGCAGRWCAVQYGEATGYIDADALRGAIATPATDGKDCAWSETPGFASPRRTVYCRGTPPAK